MKQYGWYPRRQNKTIASGLGTYKVVAVAMVAALALLFTGPDGSVVYAGSGNKVKNPGFESGPGVGWKEKSANAFPVVCSFALCGNGTGTAAPRSGSYWAWLGGVFGLEKSQVSQNVKMPSGGQAVLRFYLWTGVHDAPAKLQVKIDGVKVFSTNETKTQYHNGYVLVQKNISQFADGQKHKILFKCVEKGTASTLTTFNIDDVSITVN